MTELSELEAKHSTLVKEHFPESYARITARAKPHIGVHFSADYKRLTPGANLDNVFGPWGVIVLDMPCGHRGGFTKDTFPTQSVSCPCGAEDCWVVKYD